jgi:hypothetical protein
VSRLNVYHPIVRASDDIDDIKWVDLDRILASNDNYLLGHWITDARSWATSPSEASSFEFNARNQLTMV